MKGIIEDCSAKNGEISVSLMLIVTPGNKTPLLRYIATPESEKKYERELTEIIQSIRPFATKKI